MTRAGYDQITLKWAFATTDGNGVMCSAPVAADVDGDGRCEVFIGSYTESLFCVNGDDGTLKWSYRLPQDLVGCNCIVLHDVDGDGQLEVVFGTEPNPTVYVLKTGANVDDRLLWKQPLEGQFIAGGLAACTDTDGTGKVIACTRRSEPATGVRHGRSYVLHGASGTMLIGPVGDEDVCASGPAIADVNGDGVLEYIYGNHHICDIPTAGHAICRSIADGSVLWSYLTMDDPGATSMTIADVNVDGDLEVVVAHQHPKQSVVTPSYGIAVLSARDGKELWAREVPADGGVAIGTVNGKTIIGTGGNSDADTRIMALDPADGSTLWETDTPGGKKSTPLAVDFDGDGNDEFVLGDESNNVIIVDGTDGTILFKQRYPAEKQLTERSHDLIHRICVADVDRDGRWEILFNSSDGYARCLDTPFKVPDGASADFLMQCGSIRRLGRVPTAPAPA